ncbi:MAG: TolC family protein [Legionellales bacterium]|nr:TolC family protein [Legionellales bacterium]
MHKASKFNKFWLYILSIILMIFYISNTSAKQKDEQSLFLSMDEAITLSLSKNMAIQFAGMDRVLEKFAIKKAENDFDLQYTLSASSTILSKNSLSDDGTAIKPNLNVNPGVSLKTGLGTSFSFSAPQTVDSTGKHGSRTVMSISQPLLKGFGQDVTLNSLRNTYDREVINKLKFRNSISKAIVGIAKKYRSLISDNYKIEASRRSLVEAEKGVKNTQAKIKVGRIASTEIIQSEAQYESLQLQYLQQKNAANISRQDLLTEIGLSPEKKIYVPKDLTVSTNKIPNQDDAIKLALENNFEYQSKLNSLTTARRSLLVAKNNMLWDLNLTYSAGSNKGTVLENIKGKKFNQNLTATLTVPINSYSNKEGLLRAQIGLKKEELGIAQSRRALIANVKKQIFDINNLKTQIKFAEKNLVLAQKSYDIETRKLQIGKSSSLNVSTAQDKVLAAQKSLIDAKIAFENSLDDLHILLGTALEKWNIELEY